MFVSDSTDFIARFKPVAGKPLTFTAPGLVHGADGPRTEFIPFFRLHESRYTMYWQHATPGGLKAQQAANAEREADRIALNARTIDGVAPGEQQPESDHFFKGEGVDAGINNGRRWRHATNWFSYELNDPEREAKILRSEFSKNDAGRKFDVLINERLIAKVQLDGRSRSEIYSVDFLVPEDVRHSVNSKLVIRFVASEGSLAGALYGIRILR